MRDLCLIVGALFVAGVNFLALKSPGFVDLLVIVAAWLGFVFNVKFVFYAPFEIGKERDPKTNTPWLYVQGLISCLAGFALIGRALRWW